MPGEWTPDDLPTGTFVFVEEGLLLLTLYLDKQSTCCNVYCEGTAILNYSEGAAEMQEHSYRVRAAEPSRIYYITPEDERRVTKVFPDYMCASRKLTFRSFMKYVQRTRLFDYPRAERILLTDLYFPTILRAPLKDLTEYLDLRTEEEKTILADLQRKRLSPKSQLAANFN